MCDVWNSVKTLRETTLEIINGRYSQEYSEKNKSLQEIWARGFGDNPSVWIPEMIELKEDENGDIMYHIDENNSPYGEDKSEFHTSAGIFISENYGEFGGSLITPKGELGGNFEDVFECEGIIYAIDSLSHFGMGNMTIYKFTEDLSADIVYSTKNKKDLFDLSQLFSLNTWCVKDNIVYVLASGEVKENKNSGWTPKSVLIKIKSGKVIEKTEFDFDLCYTRNMIVSNEKIYVGADKAVVVIDTVSNEVKAYTPVSLTDEENILEKRTI